MSPAVPAQEIAVIDSAVRQGVTHVVKITSKASADSPVDRRRGQARIEAHLHAFGLSYTLLRSNAYLQNLLTRSSSSVGATPLGLTGPRRPWSRMYAARADATGRVI